MLLKGRINVSLWDSIKDSKLIFISLHNKNALGKCTTMIKAYSSSKEFELQKYNKHCTNSNYNEHNEHVNTLYLLWRTSLRQIIKIVIVKEMLKRTRDFPILFPYMYLLINALTMNSIPIYDNYCSCIVKQHNLSPTTNKLYLPFMYIINSSIGLLVIINYSYETIRYHSLKIFHRLR